ncbi:Uncharacterized protein GBIM_12824, partial [Gryllus bimaculatus]
MPIQVPPWTEFLSCPVCCNEFDATLRSPISLGCGHTVCKTCLSNLHRKQCPFDQTIINTGIENLPVNIALLQLVGASVPEGEGNGDIKHLTKEDLKNYLQAKKCIEELALYLKPFSSGNSNGGTSVLSRPMQRKLVTLINCQLMEEEGRSRAMRAARSLGERTVTELILQHQNPQQLSANLWAAVRARGCQFLGPAMQEEVLKLVLLALEDGSALSRKVLVMFVVQRLEPHFPQASKTSIGHVVQLLYRASCFKVSKREGDSSLMQLKEEFRTYEALRREHDAQIVQIATEAGLRIAPDQWSALLYGDTAHKSHMQSIIDKLQTPQSFAQSVQELVIALQRTGDPGNLSVLRQHLELLASIDPSPESSSPSWCEGCAALEAVKIVVMGLVDFIQHHGSRKLQEPGHPHNTKYKISMCRDHTLRGSCPRGTNCTFAHSEEELEKYRARNRKCVVRPASGFGKVADSNVENTPEFHNADKVFVQTDDLLYSATTPTITPAPFENSVLREGYPPTSRGIQVPAPVATAVARPPLGVPMPRVGYEYLPYTAAYPLGSQSASVYRASQSHRFPQTQGSFTPTVYNAPHNLVLNSGGQMYVSPPQPSYAASSHDHRAIEPGGTMSSSWEHNTKPVFVSGTLQPPWMYSSSCAVSKKVASKSLAALQQRKQEIITQLEKVVGKSAASAISSSACSQAREATVFPSTEKEICTSTYSIWTSGGILHTGRGSGSQVSHLASAGHPAALYRSEGVLPDDEFIPFDPPIVSKYGPISRMSKTILRPSSTVQVSASFGEGTISTPVVCRPVPAASPMASWYLNTAQGPVHSSALTSSHHVVTPGLTSNGLGDGYITIGHGIIDPPQLFLQNRNSECASETLLLESQRNYLMSASLPSPSIATVTLNNNGALNWGLKSHGECRSDDEDTYEAGIANDMLELERRWEFELEEQEKRWSSEEETGKKHFLVHASEENAKKYIMYKSMTHLDSLAEFLIE